MLLQNQFLTSRYPACVKPINDCYFAAIDAHGKRRNPSLSGRSVPLSQRRTARSATQVSADEHISQQPPAEAVRLREGAIAIGAGKILVHE